jgi:RNA polymerase sigma factor (sigma-70 family)
MKHINIYILESETTANKVIDRINVNTYTVDELSTEKGKTKLIKEFTPFLKIVCNHYKQYDANDLLSAAYLGIAKAFKKYDSSRSIKEILKYIWEYAIGSMKDYIQDDAKLVHIPRTQGSMFVTQHTIEIPTFNRPSATKTWPELLKYLEDPRREEDFSTLVNNGKLEKTIVDIVKSLKLRKDTDREIFFKTFGLDGHELMQQNEIAKEYGYSQSSITMIVKKIINAIKAVLAKNEIYESINK